MYADDTTLLSTYDTFHNNTDTDIATIQRNINEELLGAITWLSRKQITYKHHKNKNDCIPNTTKTHILPICHY